ncbi:MAG: hypothetical protein ABIH76_00495 [Candidatus Bathyarchaeota archaeon]
MKHNYLQTFLGIEKFCDDFRDDIIKNFFTTTNFLTGDPVLIDMASNNWFCYTPAYEKYYEPLHKLVEMCNLFAIKNLEYNLGPLRTQMHMLHDPETVQERKSFETILLNIKSIFVSSKKEIEAIIEALHPGEIERLDESMHCLLEKCYYSSIVMAVTATEFRLLDFMKAQDTSIAKKLGEMTLGALVNECLKNMAKYRLPEKHRALLELCDKYKIFSVHPKTGEITSRVANSVLNLAFEFLLDSEIMSASR